MSLESQVEQWLGESAVPKIEAHKKMWEYLTSIFEIEKMFLKDAFGKKIFIDVFDNPLKLRSDERTDKTAVIVAKIQKRIRDSLDALSKNDNASVSYHLQLLKDKIEEQLTDKPKSPINFSSPKKPSIENQSTFGNLKINFGDFKNNLIRARDYLESQIEKLSKDTQKQSRKR